MKQHLFAVEGSGIFPLDMLRYDECYPHNQEDVSKMEAERIGDKNLRAVTLVHYGDKWWTPTVARWSSFTWTVVDHT